MYSTNDKSEDDFSFMFDKPLRLTMCFSSSKSDETGISFRYQIGNDVKPIDKAPRTEYVTSSGVCAWR